MGLLDDAIREHLETKRLKGADPGDVAREEQEALGAAAASGDAVDHHERGGVELAASKDHIDSSEADNPRAEDSVGQETVELDMGSMLGPDSASGEADLAYAPKRAPTTGSEDSLKWEVPGDADPSSHQPDSPDDDGMEDVLEETPDFLRDTPEQERLWFEQRPPRDFDFNE
jgi:hypothetical protein